MNRIESRLKELKMKGKKAFIAFITAGDPSLEATHNLVLAFDRVGVDIVEIGIPFSDPLADGVSIQQSSQRALKQGVSVKKILNLVSAIRRKSEIPIALMSYYNPILHYGEDQFILQAKANGIDGLIIPDLPPEEADTLIKTARKEDVSTVFFLSPTTKEARIQTIANASSGFIYYVPLTGITGARKQISREYVGKVRKIKKYTDKPVCVGFGISTAQQVRDVARIADGVIVGSAIINEIVRNSKKKNFVVNVSRFVKNLKKDL